MAARAVGQEMADGLWHGRLLLWVLGWVSQYENATWAQVLSYMCVITHFDSFAKGLLDTKDVIFDITVIFLGLFFTGRSMESMRWRS